MPEETLAGDGLLQMSILEHLEELRSRILRALYGFGAAFLGSMISSDPLWKIVERPLKVAVIASEERSSLSIRWSSFPLFGCGRRWWPQSFSPRHGSCTRLGLLSRRDCIGAKRS